MSNRKTQTYDRLYVIEKLVKIVEEDGEKLVLVKWKNFSEAQSTKEPLAYFKLMQPCRDQIQKLEEEFEQKKFSSIANIQENTKEYYETFKDDIFPSTEKKVSQDKTLSKQVHHHSSIEEKVRCKIIAQELMRRKLVLGLKDLEAQDYFYFVNLHHQCQQTLKTLITSNLIPQTNSALEEIKGLYRSQNSFQYCVSIASKVYTCSTAEMKEYFLVKFTKYLHDLIRYMKTYLSQQISKEEVAIKNRGYRQKQMNKAINVIKIKDDYELNKTEVGFGIDEEDIKRNQREENQRRVQLSTIARENEEKEMIPLNEINKKEVRRDKSKEKRKISAISDFYEEHKKEMIKAGIKMSIIEELKPKQTNNATKSSQKRKGQAEKKKPQSKRTNAHLNNDGKDSKKSSNNSSGSKGQSAASRNSNKGYSSSSNKNNSKKSSKSKSYKSKSSKNDDESFQDKSKGHVDQPTRFSNRIKKKPETIKKQSDKSNNKSSLEDNQSPTGRPIKKQKKA